MSPRSVAVLGGGVAGLTASLALARDGHRVTLVERDPVDAGSPDAAFAWERKGIPHFFQPHAFNPRARTEMKKRFPDVYETVLAAGAIENDLRPKIPGTVKPEDEELQFLSVRRPLIEWSLRRAVLAQAGVEVRSGIHVQGLTMNNDRSARVETEAGILEPDIVVDAMGRKSPVRGWLGTEVPPIVSQDSGECGVIYYARYYRLREGSTLPDGPWLFSPRGDLGYMSFSSFPGDNGTFAMLLAIPSGASDLRVLKEESAFEAIIDKIPLLRRWRDPDLCEPVTPVMPMAGLQNTLNHYDVAAPSNVFPIGDALCHTDPLLALGLSFSMIHGPAVADALAANDDAHDAYRSYFSAVMPDIRERFAHALALDEARARMWAGGPVDFAHRTGDYALFSVVAGGTAAMFDENIFRAVIRRIGLLDRMAVLDDDKAMQEKIEKVFADVLAKPRPPAGPSREELLEITARATV